MYGQSFADYYCYYSTGSFDFLNKKQVLADLEFFIDYIVDESTADFQISRNAKWIAFGSSYGGTLATQLKLKVPNKINAAVTINAPILPTVAFEGFYNVVENQCKIEKIDDIVREAFKALKQQLDSCEEGEENKEAGIKCVEDIITNLRDTFNTCSGMISREYDAKDHKTFLLWWLTTILSLGLQFGNENGRTVKTEAINILLDDKESNKLNRLGAAVKTIYKSYDVQCLLVDYEFLINSYLKDSFYAEVELNRILYSRLGNRQSLFQRCSELGQFETINNDDGLFGIVIPIDFYENLCTRVYEQKFNVDYLENAIEANIFYVKPGREINNMSNILFIKRDDDFWIDLGFSSTKFKDIIKNDDSITVLLKAGDHASNADAWNYILETLKNWSGVKNTKDQNKARDIEIKIENSGKE